MNKIEIQLDRVPAVNEIAKAWKKVFSKSPIELRKNNDFDYYGGLIFANAILKGNKIAINKYKSEKLFETYSKWPKMKQALNKNYYYTFELTPNDETPGYLEIFLILTKEGNRIKNFICLNHTHKTQNWLSSIEEVLHTMNLAATLTAHDDWFDIIERY